MEDEKHLAWVTLIGIIVIALFWLIVMASTSHACSRDPETLNYETRVKYYQLVDEANKVGIDFILICANRTQEEQDHLYAQGRTRPGKIITWVKESKHSEGKAFDIAIIQRGKITWDNEDYDYIGILGEKVGLVWGGRWKEKDSGHFETK